MTCFIKKKQQYKPTNQTNKQHQRGSVNENPYPLFSCQRQFFYKCHSTNILKPVRLLLSPALSRRNIISDFLSVHMEILTFFGRDVKPSIEKYLYALKPVHIIFDLHSISLMPFQPRAQLKSAKRCFKGICGHQRELICN